ncbi:hypothetical protein GNX71_19100 [Variovorax sp. RKNM96]|uniref:hypothetical protein n=1 Tax=unclassified Variovorax TaxID=663243 RepID=UPI00197CC0C9|nr:hypothetical protein [Variovorax sp. RKNM96]QSI31574.1 hypothetical protein GNX71_19100 [Variovorax sp. RKNM96]
MRTMNTTHNPSPKTDLAVTQVLAQLLERLEHSTVPVGAEQYRSVVEHLVHEFEDVAPGADLGRLLDAYPAASEVYENLNYQHAGLCRSALDVSLAAEVSAREAIARAMGGAKTNKDKTHGEG